MGGRTLFIPIGVVGGDTPLSDIESLAAYVRENFPDADVGQAIDRDASGWDRAAVRAILKDGLLRAGPDDLVIVYWTGHGLPAQGSHRLQLADGDALMTRELATWLLASPARHVVCILDCCWSGDGMGELVDEADEIRKQSAPAEREIQTATVIVSARSEPAMAGAFVAAMMAALTDGPGPVDAEHRWDQRTDRITPAQLVAAINARLYDDGLDQHAFHRELRPSDAGRFFPSIWHARLREADGREVDARSRARGWAEEQFAALGVAPPAAWTAQALVGHRDLVAGSAELAAEDREFLAGVLDTLVLALSAESLAHALIKKTAFTEDALRSALRTATRRFDVPPLTRQFDLFHDAATRRGRTYPVTPGEAMVRFVARLAYACGANPEDRALYDWADARNLQAHQVNRILGMARENAPVRRLVVDLRAPRTPENEFPGSASAQTFEGAVPVGERAEVEIRPRTADGARAAIAELVRRNLPARFDLVDVVVPDELILIDPGTAELPVPRRRAELGSRFPVSVRHGGRLDPATDWDQVIGDYNRLIAEQPCPLRWIGAGETCDDLIDELASRPEVVVFESVPDQSSTEALIDSVYGSPIVLWPASRLDASPALKELVDRHWPALKGHVAEARWSASGTPDDEQLRRLRMVWEDMEWLELARTWENYG
ncbi:vWA-MoxR associated conflict system protein [Paractinoplanes globisporus]|uniref:vWA-MoxR associated protein middle region 2 domain-containing protein n=1 Tax=Paractinoplanes globisporus TaxID=113565 RepID=A0ABW6WXF3_9ACTN|nr:hypothetical protein [Actinoplanes globisporus]